MIGIMIGIMISMKVPMMIIVSSGTTPTVNQPACAPVVPAR